MKMMIHTAIIAMLAALSVTSCTDKPGKGQQGKDDSPAASLWIMGKDLISSVEVYSGSDLIESYAFTYDKYGRTTSVVKKDELAQTKLFDLKYTYGGVDEAYISGSYYMVSAARKTTAVIDDKTGTVTYSGDWAGATMYCIGYDRNNTIEETEAVMEYNAGAGYYSSEAKYSEVYTVNSNDVESVKIGTVTSSKSSKNSASTASSEVVISYTYSTNKDNCNFNVFLMNGDFPVWFAKELPGCKHLIKGMTMKCGEIESPVSFTMDYKLNNGGQLIQATRKDYQKGELVLERVYKITY